jgi:hypothetical protein
MINQFAIFEINKVNLTELYEELANHVDTIRAVLIKEDIPPQDLNELKAIFFRNLGRDFLNSTDHLLDLLKSFIEFKKKTDKNFDVTWSMEFQLQLKMAVIKEFRNMTYTKANIQDYLKHRDMYNIHRI